MTLKEKLDKIVEIDNKLRSAVENLDVISFGNWKRLKEERKFFVMALRKGNKGKSG